jgi:glycosyltransferase involved in cell wall biosynthesis
MEAERQVREWGLSNVQFRPWLTQRELVSSVGNAQLCLGAFGTTPQSMMTVHNKVFEALAMRLCVVTGDSPSVRSAFVHGQEIWLCRRGDPASLADAIERLRADPPLRASLAEQGHRAFLARYTVGALGALLQEHLFGLLASVHEGGKK